MFLADIILPYTLREAMNKTQKFIGLLAILPLALVALTPDLIADADAARNDANINNADVQNEFQPARFNSNVSSDEERDISVKSLAKGQ